ncbi:hypothetical protein KDX11_31925 [Burkholderia cenocepacia]|jgi:hypothetical protein|uniref:hypothetical protein n=1 Tax=Burkholderia cenocepacia TaxID=95486 RepID=UPI001221C92F|nr:hypothetical protein [Burkholderia cenocepacia]MBR8393949.1 hypothetical protein [Burkholderia cenocepacia]TAM55483.1 MAG: hypothetical protein EPN57_01755 [Paraburkholderia sp.]
MHPVLAKSFGGLPPGYYVRQFLFGLCFPVLLFLASTHGKALLALPVHLQVILVINTLLYPYSRFVYESVVGYIVGDNAFIFPVILFGAVKLFTMLLCWTFAIFIAPIGLVWLYVRSGRQSLGDGGDVDDAGFQ